MLYQDLWYDKTTENNDHCWQENKTAITKTRQYRGFF